MLFYPKETERITKFSENRYNTGSIAYRHHMKTLREEEPEHLPRTGLAAYATRSTRGRRYPEAPPRYRSEHQRDRDRIIHSSAFRRLEYKTQVFVNHEGDLFRTRLTHSLEVAQISRSIARALGLDEDLCEAVALAHDLGHTPFGHAGQDALDECMKEFGGFEHNLQSLRVVDYLEQRYAAFDGLNLTFETREGILKHCAPAKARELGEVGARFVNGGQPGLEAQLVNLADEIAYNNHDLDDALRARMVTLEQLRQLRLVNTQYEAVLEAWPRLSERRLAYEVIRRMIDAQVTDLIDTSRARIETAAPADSDAVRREAKPLVAMSLEMHQRHLELKRFLHIHMYRHYRVHRMAAKARHIIHRLFAAFMEDPRLLPTEAGHADIRQDGPAPRARMIADYIAGMTDRYAIAEYQRLFDTTTLP